ncbi:MAG TPA: glycine betaine ABC transporter substrate-binding protein [Leptolyngbyaceae cyanobacterium M33_DOE_097]|uniref:Glycine/betaine ABC transporter substrate-binding protein n=1 Tax=Oscillatoriales cyanobacterium SpSt-418 TaxID=2282169 RepID=A0A7C3KAR9_9CYAN|nr:glycine betaine ABC transporter substrate-binding protein [Leptolyngbyaceae cyanobacterium M33_DOE_097]
MNRKQFLINLAFALPTSTALIRQSYAQEHNYAKKTIVLGQVGLSFYQVKAALIQIILERLGYTVLIQEGAHEQIFPMLNQGKIDLLVAAWLPEAHASYWHAVKDRAVQLTTLYDDAYFFWGVPDYVPETSVQSIADLAKPEIAAKMNKIIQGIGAGATISVFSQQEIAAYGLNRAGYQFRTGTAAQWIGAFKQAVTQQRWIVLPTWQPQFLNQAYTIRSLADPQGVLGGRNQGILLATNTFVTDTSVQTVDILRRIQLDITAVTQMDYQVNVNGKTARTAAKEWIEANSKQVESWLQ